MFDFNKITAWTILHISVIHFVKGSFDIAPEDKGAIIYTDVSFECEVTVALGEDEDLQFFKYESGVAVEIANQNGVVDGKQGYDLKVLDTNKHLRLDVLSVDLDDEAMYECLKDISGSADPVAPFYLNVSVPPETTDIYWTNRTETVVVGVTYNLTCESTNSRPVSSFTWKKDNVNITDQSTEWQGTPDQDGYGDAWSQLSKTIVEEDDGVTYVCEIDVGAVPAAVTRTMVVRLGASSLTFNTITLATMSVSILLTTTELTS